MKGGLLLMKYDAVKREALVKKFQKSNKDIRTFCDKNNVSITALSRWITLYKEGGIKALDFEGLLNSDNRMPKDDPESLKKEILLLRIENERLKKGYQVKGGERKVYEPIGKKNTKS